MAFFVPFFAALGGAFAPYVFDGMPSHWGITILIIICSTMVASLSALSSFLSTAFAEHKLQQQSGLDDSQPPPITAAQMAAAPVTIPVPVVQPTPATPPATPSETKI